MKILVIDREALTNQLIASRLGAKGHEVIIESNKNTALDLLAKGDIDCVFLDPAPLSEARPMIFNIWRIVPQGRRPYILLLSKSATADEAIRDGANDALHKPLNPQDLEAKMLNAERLITMSRFLAVEDDVHSGQGLIGKAAFHQMYLAAIDRAFRYGEKTYLVFVDLVNYEEIIAGAGKAAADDMLFRLTGQLTFMRRQSDVIGRVAPNEFAVVLQRPMAESEPFDAITRFAEDLGKFSAAIKDFPPHFSLSLIELPQGQEDASLVVTGAEKRVAVELKI